MRINKHIGRAALPLLYAVTAIVAVSGLLAIAIKTLAWWALQELNNG